MSLRQPSGFKLEKVPISAGNAGKIRRESD